MCAVDARSTLRGKNGDFPFQRASPHNGGALSEVEAVAERGLNSPKRVQVCCFGKAAVTTRAVISREGRAL